MKICATIKCDDCDTEGIVTLSSKKADGKLRIVRLPDGWDFDANSYGYADDGAYCSICIVKRQPWREP